MVSWRIFSDPAGQIPSERAAPWSWIKETFVQLRSPGDGARRELAVYRKLRVYESCAGMPLFYPKIWTIKLVEQSILVEIV